MKKLLALVLASVLLLGVPVAYGEEYSGWAAWTQSPTSTITMEVTADDDSFVIVIPATLTVDVGTMTGSMTVTLQAGYQLYTRSLAVHIKADENGLYLVNSEAEHSVAYTVNVETPSGSVAWDGSRSQGLFMVGTGTKNSDTTATITVTVTERPWSGTYTDTLTFMVQ